ncbi:ankyrin repeat domain-containing protein [Tenacibaculum sp. MEBiC06402]|uniref:ankyrin repeat domain-containing protein n=1 Tax=unclassified Tenacibaculum TaxID=2635139 RepID=UPI003B9CD61D
MKITKHLKLIVLLLFLHKIGKAQEAHNTFDEKGRTPLINAILQKNVLAVKTLIDKGSNVNLKEKNGLQGTPLMYATSTGSVLLCELLIKKNAKINAVDINNDHALNWATYYGNVSIMDYLISKGADINLKSKHGNAIDVAYRLWHHDSVANVFRNYINTESLNQKQLKMIDAFEKRDLRKIKKLLENGVSPNLKDILGVPILQRAIQENQYELTQILLNKGANVNILNRVGQTPLAWAARFGNIEMVKLLLDAGANPNITDTKYQLTPLIAAAYANRTKIGELLIQNGAKVNHKEIINNAAALHWALTKNNEDFVKMLIENGADYKEKALEGSKYSAYDLATTYKNTELVKLFDKHNQIQKQLKGSWKVHKIKYHYPDTTYVVDQVKYGRFIFNEKNYAVMYNPMMNSRTPFKDLSKPTDLEIKKAFQSIVFNSGSYSLKKNIVHAIPDIAKVPGFENGHQYYKLEIRNSENISLTMFDETYPDGKKPEWYGKIKIQFLLKKE